MDSVTYQPLVDALASGQPQSVVDAANLFNAADLAGFIEQNLDAETGETLYRSLPLALRAKVLGYTSQDTQLLLTQATPLDELALLVAQMPSDDRADFYSLLDESRQQQLIKTLDDEDRKDLTALLAYPEGTAGALMSTDYAVFESGITASEAIEILRKTAENKETIYQSYVIDENRVLIGVVSLRRLIVAKPDTVIDSLLATGLVSTHTDTPQDDVARLIAKYDLLALPVLDEQNRLAGIITYDDAMDVIEAEATEDIHKGGTVSNLDTGITTASPFSLYRSRIQWLVILVFANIFTGAGIAHFEDIIGAHLALLFFMPLLVASAGNAGAQSATLVVRGIATGDVVNRDWLRLFSKELLVATALGLTMALTVWTVGMFRTEIAIATTVAITMIAVVLAGGLIGILLPLLLNRLGIDPAAASIPLITTIADVSGVLIYFSIAKTILGA
ncbi:magnesium transporter MgtE [Streptosporangium jomthongense]|uniref:Magnesium transporter MgtE n=1 Tax=Marinobacter aromaticivorans TaxID=1494078 RepID=A0ABW2IYG8_9GAMM|nr:magnesium transporter [Marinobacter aromaticivorans]GGE74835.1 magnesium transporter MgtE [Streptosporangium jomthongense]